MAICSSTETHADLIVAAARAGKAIFCEKPISLELAEVDRALAAVEAAGVLFQIGFNRRFDPAHQAVQAVMRGDVGEPQLVRISSRDPAPPPIDYVRGSGGIFLDMTVHDFDMARYVTGSEVVEVFARGAVRIDPTFADAGDVDTAVVTLVHESGCLTAIDNSRQAVYGYDQRVEVFGSRGIATSENPARAHRRRADRGRRQQRRLPYFFLERYIPSYVREWEAFVDAVRTGGRAAQRGSPPAPAGDRARCRVSRPREGPSGYEGLDLGGVGLVGGHLKDAFDDVLAPSHAEVDVTEAEAVRRSVGEFEPDVIVHAAILNDFDGSSARAGRLRRRHPQPDGGGRARDPRLHRLGVQRPGARGHAAQPRQPVRDAEGGERAGGRRPWRDRAHLRRAELPRAPRSQDAGFGYFVASIVRSLCARRALHRVGRRGHNGMATPTLASDVAALIRRIAEGGHRGSSTAAATSRSTGGRSPRTVEVFGLDGDLLDLGRRAQPWPVPYDTSLDATATAARLGVELPGVDEQLRRLEKPCVHDLITMGRVGVDLYPEQIGVRSRR